MSSPQMPPWLQEQLMRLQQTQQDLQSVMTQMQHLDIEGAETEKALEELKKAADDDVVFKHAGTVLIKSTKQELTAQLEERQAMTKTRRIVIEKQQARLKESLKEQETKITEMMKTGSTVSSPTEDNPRK